MVWFYLQEIQNVLRAKRRKGVRLVVCANVTCYHKLPLMVFQRENIAVCYLTPNLTSSKQPLDFGVIEIAKQRYKTLLLRDVLSFYQLDNENQQLQKR